MTPALSSNNYEEVSTVMSGIARASSTLNFNNLGLTEGDRVTIKHLPPPKDKKAKKTAEDMSEDQAASAIQARVRVRSTKANKTDETREAS